MAVTDVPTHAQIRALYQAIVLLNTDRLTDRSFSPGFICDLLSGGNAALSEEAQNRSLQRHLATFFETAQGDDLDELARDHRGLERFDGIAAIGEIQFSRPTTDAGSITIPSGTILQTAEGTQFVTTEDVLITGLTQLASISAIVVGESGIVAAGSITTITSVLDDSTITASNLAATAGGVARESDEAFRTRVRNFFPTLRRGTHAALVFGAKQVPGVVNVGTEESSVVADVSRAAVASATEGSEQSGVWTARGSTKSVKLVIAFTVAAFADSETLTLDANLQDASDAIGTGAADFGTAISSQVVLTAPGSGGPHALTGEFEQTFDVQTADAYLRAQVTLTSSASGTVIWAATLELQGTPSKVKVYIADSTGEANAALISATETELESYRSAGVEVEVVAATVVSQAVDVSVTFAAGFGTAAASEAILRAIVDEVNGLQVGETLFPARITAAAGAIAGVLNVTVNTPSGPVVPNANELIRTTLETVTIT